MEKPSPSPEGQTAGQTAGQTRGPTLRSALLDAAGFRHAFFTRRGGVSPPPWDSLNFAASVGDDPGNVAENVRRAASELGVDPARVYFLSQVHGTAHRVLAGAEDRDEVVRFVGDITLSRAQGVACGVRSADCVSVLLADTATGAVAAVHSGWRGTVANAVAAGVVALRALGGGSGDLIAAVGPHIGACCFEVGDDVAEALAGCSTAGARVLVPPGTAGAGETGGGKTHVDLRRIVHAQLEAAGVGHGRIDDVAGCTCCEPGRFHSFRRDGARSGRLLSAIVPAPR
jgi:YfiH family protein